MGVSAIARIEHYKHYEAGIVHKEAVRELTGYKNPNWNPDLTDTNVFFERMELDKPFEKWIYDYRKDNNISGRYIENSSNPKSETNAMCQALFTVPSYIDVLSREEQIKVLRICYDFFRSEFPNVPVLEAVCHFDESSPHLQVNFLPVIEREHSKRGMENIFSTTLLMPGKDFFPKFQDRFYEYMQNALSVELERNKGSKVKHLKPKEYREVTAQLKALEEEKEEVIAAVESVKEEYFYWEEQLRDIKASSSLSKSIKLYERIRDLERENKLMKSFIDFITKKLPALEKIWFNFKNSFNKSKEFGRD